jgi:tetratricopeptide (TPR) repeat protein
LKKCFIYLLAGVAWIFSHAQAQITASEIEESEKMLSYVHVPMFHKARLLIENKQYSEALAKVDTLYRIYPYIPAVSYMAGVCWSQSDAHKKNAVAPFVILLGEPQRFPDLYFWVATAYEKNDSIRSAKEWYQKFIDQEKHPEIDLKALKETAARKIENLKMAGKMKSYVSLAEIKNMGSPINSEDDEYVPLLPSDESFMIFTYRGKKSKGGKQNLNKNSFLNSVKKEESMYFEDVLSLTKSTTVYGHTPNP